MKRRYIVLLVIGVITLRLLPSVIAIKREFGSFGKFFTEFGEYLSDCLEEVDLKKTDTEKEIEFTLRYTLSGEEKTLSGTAICKYQGFALENESELFAKKYKISFLNEKIKSIDDESLFIPILDLRTEDTTEKFGYQVLDVFFNGGAAEYYMEEDYDTWHCPQELNLVEFSYLNPEGEVAYSGFEADAAEEVFGIRLISFEYDIK